MTNTVKTHAAGGRLEKGLPSLSDAPALIGRNWEKVDRQAEHERATIAELGLPDPSLRWGEARSTLVLDTETPSFVPEAASAVGDAQ